MTPVRGAVCDDDPARDPSRTPASLGGYLRSKARLAIEHRQKLAGIDDLSLDLDHQNRRRLSVPAEQVDRAALAPDGERHLGQDVPSSDVAHQAGNQSLQCRMPRAEQPIELTAPPARQDVDADVECGGGPAQDRQRYPVQVPSLDQRYQADRHTGPKRHVTLPPASLHAHCAKGGTHPLIAHRFNVELLPYGPLRCRSPADAHLRLGPRARGCAASLPRGQPATARQCAVHPERP
jgi:hypothetical protein